MLSRRFSVILLLILFFNPQIPWASEEEMRTISVGTVEVLDFNFTPAPNLLVGNRAVLELVQGSSSQQIKVIAVKKGISSLVVFREDGKVGRKFIFNVVTNDLSSDFLSIRKLLQSVEGISVQVEGDKIVIDGEILTLADKIRVSKVASAYQNVLDLTTLSKLVH